MAGARASERETRGAGRPQGAIGPVALELLAQLYRLARRFKGRLEPSLDFLMGAIKRSRTAVVRALRQLADAGFVEWTRRFVPVAIDGPGPRYRQTSNVYRLCQPTVLRRLLGKRGEACPIPTRVSGCRWGPAICRLLNFQWWSNPSSLPLITTLPVTRRLKLQALPLLGREGV